MSQLFDFLNAINFTKEDNLTEFNQSDYAPFVINRFLSGKIDAVFHANEMNRRPWLTRRMQFDYLQNSLRKKKRFSKWLKANKIEDLDAVKDYYGYSSLKAKDALKLLSAEDLEKIKDFLKKGGIHNEKKSK